MGATSATRGESWRVNGTSLAGSSRSHAVGAPAARGPRNEGVIIDGGTDRRPVQVGVRCLGPRAAMRTYAGGRGDARELGRSASHCDEVLKGSEVDRLGNVSE